MDLLKKYYNWNIANLENNLQKGLDFEEKDI